MVNMLTKEERAEAREQIKATKAHGCLCKATDTRACGYHGFLGPTLDDIESLEAENAALRECILDLTPSHRRRGECWCGHGQDIEGFGHSPTCRRAYKIMKERTDAE